MSDSIQSGSTEIPDVVRTLAGVLPQFEGDALEAQLQTYDIFLETLAPSARLEVASLLQKAATETKSPTARARMEEAARSVAQGGRAAEPYDHAKAMEAYQESFRKSFPNAPVPAPVADPRGEGDPVAPKDKRSHPQILAQLDKIEAELKKIGRWSDNPPDLQAAVERGEIKSYLDAPTFELWLQALFLPRARKAAREDELPAGSQVGEMARRQYDYMSVNEDALPLLQLLQDFDEMVIQSHAG